MPLTPTDVYKALAANPFGKPNTAKNWNDVNPALPAIPIRVYGPPSTSGTRDALAELILTKGCESDPAMKALKDSDKDEHKKICTEVRTDGAYVEQGENDNLIVQKIAANPKAVGVFGFSFLEENMDKLKGITDGRRRPRPMRRSRTSPIPVRVRSTSTSRRRTSRRSRASRTMSPNLPRPGVRTACSRSRAW